MFMANCLETANKAGFTSIAFPALGTGNLGYPKTEVARMMFSNVEVFGRNNPTTSIKDVRFVIYEKDIEVLKVIMKSYLKAEYLFRNRKRTYLIVMEIGNSDLL